MLQLSWLLSTFFLVRSPSSSVSVHVKPESALTLETGLIGDNVTVTIFKCINIYSIEPDLTGSVPDLYRTEPDLNKEPVAAAHVDREFDSWLLPQLHLS